MMDKLTEAIEDHRCASDAILGKHIDELAKAARTLQKIVEAMPKNPYMDQRAFESAVYSSTMKILRDGGYIE